MKSNRLSRLTGTGVSILLISTSVIWATPISPTAAAPSDPTFTPTVSAREDAANRPNRGTISRRPAVAPSREFTAANSKKAKDKHGYEKSLYRGKYYHADQEGFRKCVMSRESHFTYTAANSRSSARGAYQFLDNGWRKGLVHMMLKESKKSKDGLRPQIRRLFDYPIHKWSRYMQDRAWFTALNYNGKWSGKKHWNPTVSGTGC